MSETTITAEQLQEKVREVFIQNGLEPFDDLETELTYDSLQFVSLIAGIEEALEIQFDDSILSSDQLKSFSDFFHAASSVLGITA